MDWTAVTTLTVAGLLLLACTPFVISGVLEVLLALGLASLSTAALLELGILNPDWALLLSCLAGLTLLYAVLIWRPLRRLMNQGNGNAPQVSDWVGLALTLPADYHPVHQPYLHYSGVRWHVQPADPAQPLTAGAAVTVIRAQVGQFWVAPADQRNGPA